MGRNVPWIDHWETTYHYVDLYARILQRPLVTAEKKKACAMTKNGLTIASGSQALSYRKAWRTHPHVLSNEQIPNQTMAPM